MSLFSRVTTSSTFKGLIRISLNSLVTEKALSDIPHRSIPYGYFDKYSRPLEAGFFIGISFAVRFVERLREFVFTSFFYPTHCAR